MGEDVPKRSFDSISTEWLVLAGAMCMLPVFLLVAYFADGERALVASCIAGMIVLAVSYFWDLRNRIWFWITIIFIAFLHVPLVLFFPPPNKRWNYGNWNYVQMLPFGLLDFAIVYGIIRLVEKIAGKSS